MEGRKILDTVLIANEVVDGKRISKEEGIVFKIDFEKAHDHVDWGFLEWFYPKIKILDERFVYPLQDLQFLSVEALRGGLKHLEV